MSTVVKYVLGDLHNGNLEDFNNYEDAYEAYEKMCAEISKCCVGSPVFELNELNQEIERDEGQAYEETYEAALNFHYVAKVEITTDEDGEESEELEILDGGQE